MENSILNNNKDNDNDINDNNNKKNPFGHTTSFNSYTLSCSFIFDFMSSSQYLIPNVVSVCIFNKLRKRSGYPIPSSS